MKKLFLIIFFLVLVTPLVSAKQGHIRLLAVKDGDDGIKGSIADLYLEIKPGTGRVFLDTFPLTKADTQISTRFAKEIACNYIDVNCDNHDFIYTITADSVIVGGPSAGAAIAALTVAMLKNFDINEEATISGTINSGGVVGPVGGLKEKIDIALSVDIKKVLIPKGERFLEINDTENITIDLIEYGKNNSLEIIEAGDLGDVVFELTGKKIDYMQGKLEINKDYLRTMEKLANGLCKRSENLKKDIEVEEKQKEIMDSAFNLTEKGKNAFGQQNYYSSASYCFGANTKLSYLSFLSKGLSKEDITKEISITNKSIIELDKRIEQKEIKTLTDLEAYVIIKDRLKDARDSLKKSSDGINDSEGSLYNLAYGSERLISAYAWYSFFDSRGKEFGFDKEIIKNSCKKRLSEVEERYQYVKSFVTISIEDRRESIDNAYEDLNNGAYELCLFKASKIKAEIDILLNVVGVKEEYVNKIVEQKLENVKKIIIKENAKDIFPVMGYSYYEYANELKDADKYSALLYAEYALELSNLDVYFKEKSMIYNYNFDKEITFFLAGILVGAVVILLVIKKKKRRK